MVEGRAQIETLSGFSALGYWCAVRRWLCAIPRPGRGALHLGVVEALGAFTGWWGGGVRNLER
jgi:hypothetical protein